MLACEQERQPFHIRLKPSSTGSNSTDMFAERIEVATVVECFFELIAAPLLILLR